MSTINTLETILEFTTKNFDIAKSSVTQLSKDFEKNSENMVRSLDKIEGRYINIVESAKKAQQAQILSSQKAAEAAQKSANDMALAAEKAAKAQEAAILRQQKALFSAGRSLSGLGSTTRDISVVNGLSNTYSDLQTKLQSGPLSNKEFQTAILTWQKSLTNAKQIIRSNNEAEKEAISIQKSHASEMLRNEKVMQSQSNTIARVTDSLKTLNVQLTQTKASDEQLAGYNKRLSAAFSTLQNELSKPLTSGQSQASLIKFNSVVNDVKRESGLVLGPLGRMREALLDITSASQLALGPLSGIAARIYALMALSERGGLKLAVLGGSLVALGAALYKGSKDFAGFEQGLAQTGASLSLTSGQVGLLGNNLITMSKQLGVSVEDLNKISLSAAQAGVGFNDLGKFTETISKLTKVTDLTADSASDMALTLLNLSKEPTASVGKLADKLVLIGQESLGGERRVMELATEIEKAGTNFGMTSGQAIAFAGAMANVAQQSESARTSLLNAFTNIASIVNEGGDKLDALGKIAGMTGEKFADMFKQNQVSGFQAFINGLAKSGNDINKISELKTLGFANSREIAAIQGLTTVSQQYTTYLKQVGTQTAYNNQLNQKYARVMDTVQGSFDKMIQSLTAITTLMGKDFSPLLKSTFTLINNLASSTSIWSTGLKTLFEAFVALGIWKGLVTGFGLLKAVMYSTGIITRTTAAEMTAAGVAIEGTSIKAKLASINWAALGRAILPLLALKAISWFITAGDVDETKAATDAQTELNKKLEQYNALGNKILASGDKKKVFTFEFTIKGDINSLNNKIKDIQEKMNKTQTFWFGSGGSHPGASWLERVLAKPYKEEMAKLTEERNNLAKFLDDFRDMAQSKSDAIANALIINLPSKAEKNIFSSIHSLLQKAEESYKAVETLKTEGAEKGQRTLKIGELVDPTAYKLSTTNTMGSFSNVFNATLQDLAKSSPDIGKIFSSKINTVWKDIHSKNKDALATAQKDAKDLLYSIGAYVVDSQKQISEGVKTVTKTEHISDRTYTYYDRLSNSLENSRKQLESFNVGGGADFEKWGERAKYISKLTKVMDDLGESGADALARYKKETGDTTITMDKFIKKLISMNDEFEDNKQAIELFTKSIEDLRTAQISVAEKTAKINLHLAGFDKNDLQKDIDSTVNDLVSDYQNAIDKMTVSKDIWSNMLISDDLTSEERKRIENNIKNADKFIKKTTEKMDVTKKTVEPTARNEAAVNAMGRWNIGTSGTYHGKQKQYDQEYSVQKEYISKNVKDETEKNQLLSQLDAEYLSKKLEGWNTFYTNLSSLSSAKSKELRAIGKGAAVAEATLSAYEAINKAWASEPWPYNIPAVAMTTAEVFANIASIVGLKSGGFVSGSGGPKDDKIPAKLSNGEFVINAEATRKHRSLLEEINSGGFANGGYIATSIGPSSSPNITIQNYGTSKDFEVQQLTESDYRIIARDEARKQAKQTVISEMGNASSKSRRALATTSNIRRNIRG